MPLTKLDELKQHHWTLTQVMQCFTNDIEIFFYFFNSVEIYHLFACWVFELPCTHFVFR